jgi:hypothetical protein
MIVEESGLPSAQGDYLPAAAIWVKQIPLLFKIASLLLVSFVPLTVSALVVSRMGTSAQIYTPRESYLPGNQLPKLSEQDSCTSSPPYSTSCLVRLQNHEIYWDYEFASHKIIRTTVSAEENTIGDLILAWGTPIGFDQYDTSIIVSWGIRSALLVTNSFQPNSRVRFIQYDTEPLKRSPWRGFGGS